MDSRPKGLSSIYEGLISTAFDKEKIAYVGSTAEGGISLFI